MRGKVWAKGMLATGALTGALMAQANRACGQGAEPAANQQVDLATVGALLQRLQEQVQNLHAEVSDLKAQQQSAKLPTIGFLVAGAPSTHRQWVSPFVQGLHDAGRILVHSEPGHGTCVEVFLPAER